MCARNNYRSSFRLLDCHGAPVIGSVTKIVLEEELKAMVGARRFERVGSRKGHRNGTYLRRLLTSLRRVDSPEKKEEAP